MIKKIVSVTWVCQSCHYVHYHEVDHCTACGLGNDGENDRDGYWTIPSSKVKKSTGVDDDKPPYRSSMEWDF